ncbi:MULTISPECIES: hypothetical protein [Pseudomonas]|uniref:hypothetical protein n=1 Tax=Pseudomonas TaxID=286 RepID=UPI00215C75BA|nr:MULTISPECIES: hypothetical protein [unclassified Pseudomonas]MCR8931109.1 hypothetical protein [Pseudomonas sp. S11A4]MCR8974717.1 hypothetical protein [Pseudomonas sp. S11P7]
MKHATEIAQVEMHPLMQQRVDVLRVLMIRTQAARETFARLAGLVMPEKQLRFQVRTVGKAFHVVNLSTGKTAAFRWTYKAALDMAIQFETKANRPAGDQQ